MNLPRRAGPVFSAVAFMTIGAVLTLLLSAAGGEQPADRTRVRSPGAVDIGFSQDMIVHHQQAVTMAQSVLGRASPAVEQPATAIELGQLKEIGQLQGWLALWNAPQVPSGAPMTWMTAGDRLRTGGSSHGTAHGGTAGPAMPGMASVEEMNRLGDLHGTDLDTWFLQLMIRHHQGGLIMTDIAAREAADPHVRAFATLMTTEQQQEIATMSGLLSALGRRPLPAPSSPSSPS